MDMKQLEAFVYVVETCSFSKAGQLLHLTQPTISSHISALERELKIKLIVRTTKETYPSDAGKLLYGYAKEILNMRENAIQAIQVFSQEMRGTITVAASTIPGQYYLPKLLQGELDAAALPVNAGATLYQKSGGKVESQGVLSKTTLARKNIGVR